MEDLRKECIEFDRIREKISLVHFVHLVHSWSILGKFKKRLYELGNRYSRDPYPKASGS